MDSVFGLVGNGFVLLAADGSAARSIVVFKTDEDKIVPLTETTAVAVSGPQADMVNMTSYVSKDLKVFQLNNGINLTTDETANYVRTEMAIAIRKAPIQCNLLLGGFDASLHKGMDENTHKDHPCPSNGARLYFIDYMGSMAQVNFGSQGYASNFLISVMDREWRANMNLEDALGVARKCIHELRTRFLINQPNFVIKVIDGSGIRKVQL